MHSPANAPPQVQLTAADRAAIPPVFSVSELDEHQRAAIQALGGGEVVIVHGVPGSGRTSLVLAAAASFAGSDIVVLAPRRRISADLKDALAVAGAHHVQVMTPQALAFALVRRHSAANSEPPPVLVTGAEQDALLTELIAAREQWALPMEAAGRSMPTFRTELRDVITRAQELDIDPERLAHLGRVHGRPEWIDAGALLQDYHGVLAVHSGTAVDAGRRLDTGGMVRAAVTAVTTERIALPDVLLVDDAHDLTAAAAQLVAQIALAGSQVLVTSCPDIAVEGFRGGRADAAALIEGMIAKQRSIAAIALAGRYASAAPIRAVADRLRERLPLSSAPAQLRQPSTVAENPTAATAVLTGHSELDEAHMIAAALRDAHYGERIPYDEMAVVCRSGAVVERVADQLSRAGLPVRVPQQLGPLRDEPVVKDLLQILHCGGLPTDYSLDPHTALALLHGPFGEADAHHVRATRRALRDAIDSDEPDSRTLLARALLLPPPELARTLTQADAALTRINAMIDAARTHLDQGAEQALWAAWDAAKLESAWQKGSLANSHLSAARARTLSRRLDAIVALFAVAERFTQQRPYASAEQLIDHIQAQTVAEDTLAPQAALQGFVDVLTPAQIAGRHRDTIVIARLQEDAWPNLRLRSSVFGAADLAMLNQETDPVNPEQLRARRRAAVIDEEIRLAVSALTRARSRVLVTAVDDGDQVPSALHSVLAQHSAPYPSWVDENQVRQDPGPAPEPRHLVASLRRALHDSDPDQAAVAAAQLLLLRASGADGTDPERWYHQEPSTTQEVFPSEEPIVLSPSALEHAHACPLGWLLTRSGGDAGAGPAQSVGTIVHAIAEEHPSGADDDALLERLHELIAPLDLDRSASGRRTREHAEAAIVKLGQYLRESADPVAVEAGFTVELAGVTLRGKIDRIEGDERTIRVVDLKTGRTAKSKAAAEEDLQLAAYQVAIREGALDDHLGSHPERHLAGAKLVYVGTDTKTPSERLQPPLDSAEDPQWFDHLVAEVAADVSGTVIEARRGDHCRNCAVRSSCPLMPEGVQL